MTTIKVTKHVMWKSDSEQARPDVRQAVETDSVIQEARSEPHWAFHSQLLVERGIGSEVLGLFEILYSAFPERTQGISPRNSTAQSFKPVGSVPAGNEVVNQ